ncbi:MAG TPA: MFS transporter [Chloroflexota bacterium]|nr:MFS transporter [Chloroflexota bacterium]
MGERPAGADAAGGPVKSETSWGRQLAALWVAQLISALAFSFALPFLPLYIQALGVPDAREAGLWAGASSAAFSLVMATFGPIWGSIADRRGPRLMVGRAMFGGALVIGCMGLVRSVYGLFGLRVLQGAITGVQAAITVLLAAVVPQRRLAWGVGLLQMATFAGASVGPLVGGYVADQYGFRPAFLITGALMLLSGAIIFLCVPEPARSTRAAARVGMLTGLRWSFTSPAILAMVTIMFVLQFAATVTSPVLPLFIKDLAGDTGQAASITGLILGLGGLFGSLSAIGAGRAADSLGHKPVLLLAAFGSTLCYAPQALVTDTSQLLVLRVGLGLFNGALIPSTQAVIGLSTPPERRGVVFGIAASAASLGSAAGPLVGAGVAATLGVRAVFVVTAALLLLTCLVLARSLPGRSE